MLAARETRSAVRALQFLFAPNPSCAGFDRDFVANQVTKRGIYADGVKATTIQRQLGKICKCVSLPTRSVLAARRKTASQEPVPPDRRRD
jgi:hypothetical protein